MISLALRSGIPLPAVHRQLRGISSDRAVGLGPNKVMSLPDAVGLALEEWMKAKQGVQQELLAPSALTETPTMTNAPVTGAAVLSTAGDGAQFEAASGSNGQAFIGTCPDCGSQLEFAEGCAKCHVCGFSECG